jgi:hypothetical protein
METRPVRRTRMTNRGKAMTANVQDGCGWLMNRVGTALDTVTGLKIADTSEIAAADQYLHPIVRTFQQAVLSVGSPRLTTFGLWRGVCRSGTSPFPTRSSRW